MSENRRSGKLVRLLILGGVCAGIVLFPGGLSMATGDRYEIGDLCLDCHDEMATPLEGTPHALTSANSGPGIAVGCIDCHAGWEVHTEDPDADNIENPGKLDPTRAAVICAGCHNNAHQVSMQAQNPHAVAGLNCSSCHSVHGPDGPSLKNRSTDVCLGCHTELRGAFELTSNHRVLEGVVTCADCHKFAQQQTAPFSHALDRTCLECHQELEGPYPYEHQATNSYSVEGGGCSECHEPHGSPFDRLLREPATQLCEQCHIVPGHRIAHGGQFAGEDCLSCHTDIHGSFTNDHYFPMGVPPATCSSSECHPLGGL